MHTPLPIVDLHCDTADRLGWQLLSPELKRACGLDFYGPGDAEDPAGCLHLDANRCHLSLKAVGSTPWAQCLACFIPDELSPEQALAFYRSVSAHADTEITRCGEAARWASDANAVRGGLASGGFTAIRTIENARLFAHRLDLIDELAGEGVLMASLSWNAAGPLASGMDAPERGLTPLGRDALRRMEEVGMALDVSHLNDAGFADALRLAARPFAASHSNSRALCGHPRNLTDAQFCAIRDRGGVVGLNFCPDFLREDARSTPPCADDLCRHLEHWLNLDGADAVALGSDFDGTDVPACVASAASMPDFQQVLIERFGERLAEKICYRNALAFFERVGR